MTLATRTGLTEAEAAARLAVVGRNELPRAAPERGWHRVLRQLREPLAILLLLAAGISAFGLGERLDGGAILAIVVLNAGIGAVQEGRATRALEALRSLEAPSALVRRGGRQRSLPAAELVHGDLVLLSAGDRVPADLRIVRTSMLEVDESLLTGESLPVAKAVSDGESGTVSAGTYVSSGTAEGVVERTGSATRLGGIAASLAGGPRPTPLQRELARLSVRLGALAVVVAAGFGTLVLVRAGISAEGIEEAFLASVALAVAAVPEGLATVVVVGLALGVRRLAAEGAIVRRLPAVETLGSTQVILTDKTGTLTENRMVLGAIVLSDGAERSPSDAPPETASRLARAISLCSDAEVDPPSGDPLEIALLEPLGRDAVARERSCHPRIDVAPFDPGRRRMASLHRTGDGGSLLVVKGAPEEVLPLCGAVLDDGDAAPLTEDGRRRLLASAGTMADRGGRVLALADREGAEGLDDGHLTFIGLVSLRDPIRPEAARAVSEARAAGVRAVMVTGDHPGTALAIARGAGIASAGDEAATGERLDPGLARDPLRHSVYARVGPEQKLGVVRAFQEQGNVVAVTGDGANDAPALRRADIGVAMGRAGSDVAREAADMIVTDDNLATIVTAIGEGRGIYDNIRKVVDYLVGGNLSEIFVVVSALLFFPALGVPLSPLQLLWVNLLTDGLPALALGIDPTDPEIMRRPPRSPTAAMLPGSRIAMLAGRGLLMASAAIGALAIARFGWGDPWPAARSLMFTVLVIAHLLYAFVVRGRLGGRNRWLLGAIATGIALQIVIVSWPAAHAVFGTQTLGVREWVVAVLAGTLPTALMLAHGRRPPRRELG